MYQITVNLDKCTDCGVCEEHLPGLRENVKRNKKVYVSDTNMFSHSINISSAIDVCESGAIEFGEYFV